MQIDNNQNQTVYCEQEVIQAILKRYDEADTQERESLWPHQNYPLTLDEHYELGDQIQYANENHLSVDNNRPQWPALEPENDILLYLLPTQDNVEPSNEQIPKNNVILNLEPTQNNTEPSNEQIPKNNVDLNLEPTQNNIEHGRQQKFSNQVTISQSHSIARSSNQTSGLPRRNEIESSRLKRQEQRVSKKQIDDTVSQIIEIIHTSIRSNAQDTQRIRDYMQQYHQQMRASKTNESIDHRLVAISEACMKEIYATCYQNIQQNQILGRVVQIITKHIKLWMEARSQIYSENQQIRKLYQYKSACSIMIPLAL
ncbi:hypothetical protein FGO68_gene14688 [Halteria grandinella]|uniref:Uncharacterized protein n=1 Tax=Halteria grandinella TaxID=5974 RepID=A0A8J8NRZ8_HALGN|nr:hypothetical protein FGO68_gene14688 [Halteria grandinella]